MFYSYHYTNVIVSQLIKKYNIKITIRDLNILLAFDICVKRFGGTVTNNHIFNQLVYFSNFSFSYLQVLNGKLIYFEEIGLITTSESDNKTRAKHYHKTVLLESFFSDYEKKLKYYNRLALSGKISPKKPKKRPSKKAVKKAK